MTIERSTKNVCTNKHWI